MGEAKLEEVEAICRQFLEGRMPVFAQDVPLAQARAINGLRAVFGEVRMCLGECGWGVGWEGG